MTKRRSEQVTERKVRVGCGGWRAVGVGFAAGVVWFALVSAGGCAGPAKPGPGGPEPKRIAEGSEGMEGGPARPLPTLEEELEAKRERDRLKARASGLPTLEEELKAKQAREGKAGPAAAVPAAAPTVPPAAAPAAEVVKEAPVTADEFRPGWWVDGAVEKDGVVRVAAKGEGVTLVEARRAAVEAARATVREAVGPAGRVGDAPVHSAAVRLGDGRYRAFVMMEGKR
ncbi:MAG: hypothetical protein IT436_12030 [Phycisphaerales bacterium]|nr:hypothetical protein [Phycisphaerales bacterium]